MEENRAMLILLMVLAGLAFLFEIVGFFGPGWLVYKLRYNNNFNFVGHGTQFGGGAGYVPYAGQSGTYQGGTYGGTNYGGAYGGNYPGNYPQGGTYGGGGYGYGGYQPGYGGSMTNLIGTPNVVVTMSVGLWAFHSCVEDQILGEDCKDTYKEIQSKIGMVNLNANDNSREEGDKLFDDMTEQKVLATLAFIFSVLGLLFNILLFTPLIESSKCKRVTCGLLWVMCAILLFSAIGVQGKLISDLQNFFDNYDLVFKGKYKWDNYVPWSLVLLGFSAFFALLNAVLTLFMLPRCVTDTSERGSYSVEKPERGYYEETPNAMNEYT